MKKNITLLVLSLNFIFLNQLTAQSNVSWGEVKSTLSESSNFRQVWLLFQQGGFIPLGNLVLNKNIISQKFELMRPRYGPCG